MANTASSSMVVTAKLEKTGHRRSSRRLATTLAVVVATALLACIDSKMDAFTLEDAAMMISQWQVLIIAVFASILFSYAGWVAAAWEQGAVNIGHAHNKEVRPSSPVGQGVVEQRIEPPLVGDLTVSEQSFEFLHASPTDTFSMRACVDAGIEGLCADTDSAISAELWDQSETVMASVEVEQMAELRAASFDTRDLMQEAVNAFDASFPEDKLSQAALVQSDVSIDEALSRLEQEVQRRSSGRVGQSSRRSTLGPLMGASLTCVLGLCAVGVDQMHAPEICTCPFLEVGIVSVVMPVGYALCSRLKVER